MSSSRSSSSISSHALTSSILSQSRSSSSSSPTFSPSDDPPTPPSAPTPSSPPDPQTTSVESSSFSSSSSSNSFSSTFSLTSSLDVASSIQTSSSSGEALPESTSSSTASQRTLRPVGIAAVVLGVVTAVLGIIALSLVFFFRRKRRNNPLYGLPFAKENKGMKKSTRSNLEAPPGGSYFRSLSDQKGTVPLLQNCAPSSDLSHEPYLDNDHMSLPVLTLGPPSLSFSQQETLSHTTTQNTTLSRPLRSEPPQPNENPEIQGLFPRTPENSVPKPNNHFLMSPTQVSDDLSRDVVLAYADENLDAGRDSPSIYSQRSGNFRFSSYTALSRGPSNSSHYSMHRFSVPPTVLESPNVSGGSSEKPDIDARSEDDRTVSSETITPATRASVSSPPNLPLPELCFLNTDPSQQQHQSQTERNSGVERQNTTTVASLLKARQQRRSELLPTAPSAVSHIERAGSIRPGVEAAGENNGMNDRETYGRRFRRMKAGQGNVGMAI